MVRKKHGQDKAVRDFKFGYFSRTGNEFFLNDDMNKAIDSYNEALAIRPLSADILSNRGAAFLRVRDYHKALADLRGMYITLIDFITLTISYCLI